MKKINSAKYPINEVVKSRLSVALDDAKLDAGSINKLMNNRANEEDFFFIDITIFPYRN